MSRSATAYFVWPTEIQFEERRGERQFSLPQETTVTVERDHGPVWAVRWEAPGGPGAVFYSTGSRRRVERFLATAKAGTAA